MNTTLPEMMEKEKQEQLRQIQTQWFREQEELQQRLHDEEWERIREGRKLVDERSHPGSAFSSANRSTQRFYDNCRADMEEQIYAAHGLSADRVEGMEEFGNGRFRGLAIASMLATLGMIVAATVLSGINTTTTIFGVAALGVEGSLLNAERKVPGWYRILCRHLIMIPILGFMAVLILSQKRPEIAEIMTIVFASMGIVLTFFGTTLFLLSSPYSRYRKQMKAARANLKEIQKLSDESDRKRQREKLRERRKAGKMDRKEEKRRMRAEFAEAQRNAREKAGALAKGAKNAAGSAMTAAGHVLPWRKKQDPENQAKREQAAKLMAAEIYEELKAENKIPVIAREEIQEVNDELEFDTSINE